MKEIESTHFGLMDVSEGQIEGWIGKSHAIYQLEALVVVFMHLLINVLRKQVSIGMSSVANEQKDRPHPSHLF